MNQGNSSLQMANAWVAAYAAATIVVACCCLFESEESIPREPSHRRDLLRTAQMYRIFFANQTNALDYLRMSRGPFFNLARMLREGGHLRDTSNVPIEEQLAMFLHIVGHNAKNRVVQINFLRSGETISRYFNAVLSAILKLRDIMMKQPGMEVHEEIRERDRWYPWFADCIGMIDGTHIEASVPEDIVARFRGRKDKPTQNVLAAVTPNKLFCYVLAGWEGSANDFAVLKDALSMPPPAGLRLLPGKYYLCDAGYTTMPGFIAPYRGVRYHLKEQHGRTPNNHQELFNLRHSSLRSKIESAFGILKNRFKILTCHSFFPYETQVDLVLACCILHNYIMMVDPDDMFINEPINFPEENGEIFAEEVESSMQNMTQREQREAREMWCVKRDSMAKAMWFDYCMKERGGIETEVFNDR